MWAGRVSCVLCKAKDETCKEHPPSLPLAGSPPPSQPRQKDMTEGQNMAKGQDRTASKQASKQASGSHARARVLCACACVGGWPLSAEWMDGFPETSHPSPFRRPFAPSNARLAPKTLELWNSSAAGGPVSAPGAGGV